LSSDDEFIYEELGFTPFDAALRRTEVVVRVTEKRTGAVLGVRKLMKGAVATLCQLPSALPAADQQSQNAQWDVAVNAHGDKGWRSIAVAATDLAIIDEKQVRKRISSDV
jgi:hypothetical protein